MPEFALKGELVHLRQTSRLGQCQSLLTKEREGQLLLQLLLRQVRRCENIIRNRDRHLAVTIPPSVQQPERSQVLPGLRRSSGRFSGSTLGASRVRSLRSPLRTNTCRALDPPGALPGFSDYRSDGVERFDSYQAHHLNQPLFSHLRATTWMTQTGIESPRFSVCRPPPRGETKSRAQRAGHR
jgi:hypothetical protein